jgi:hypothetical protein
MIESRTFMNLPCAATVVGWLALATSIGAAPAGPPVSIQDRIRGAEEVVVATAASVRADWQENAFGDRLIVSEVLLRVEEALKGQPGPSVVLQLEGGTLDGVTMRVSTLPDLRAGERAVFFLERGGASGTRVPHLRGQGILKLDSRDMVTGSSLALNDIRRMAREGR